MYIPHTLCVDDSLVGIRGTGLGSTRWASHAIDTGSTGWSAKLPCVQMCVKQEKMPFTPTYELAVVVVYVVTYVYESLCVW